MRYIYYPFVQSHHTFGFVQRTANTWTDGQGVSRFDGGIIRRDPNIIHQLAGLHAGDQLYIIGHGRPGSDHLSGDQGERITIRDLAQLLVITEGLPNLDIAIKLFSCSGGQAGNLGEPAMAQRLRWQLGFLNILHPAVYGYTLTLKVRAEDIGIGHPSKIGIDAMGQFHKAKTVRRRFF
jgi:hypothetical protein